MEFYAGRGMGAFIEQLIYNAKEILWVCCPHISRKYAKLLTKKSEEGVNVRVILFDNNFNKESIDLFKKFIKKYRPSILGSLFKKFKKESKPRPKIEILIPNDTFFNGKIYISDDIAIVGSPSLREDVLFQSVEYVVVIKSEVIERVKNLFEMLWERGLSCEHLLLST